MKYFFLFSLIALVACSSTDGSGKAGEASPDSIAAAAMKDTNSYTAIQWLDSIDTRFSDKIKDGQVIEVSWRFRNAGDKPLVVQEVRAGCGCTVAEKPSAPVAPGGEGLIKAKFDSHNQGPSFHKSVTVTANTKDNQTHVLSFSGEIIK